MIRLLNWFHFHTPKTGVTMSKITVLLWVAAFLACTVGYGAAIANYNAISLQSLAAGTWVSGLILLVGVCLRISSVFMSEDE